MITLSDEVKSYYSHIRQLDDGDWVGITKLAFTYAVCCGITEINPFTYRWCFESLEEAEFFFNTMKDFDEVPTKIDTLKGHRYLDAPRLVLYDQLGYPRW